MRGRLGNDTREGLAELDSLIKAAVDNGLRGSLASGNLVTGSLYVSLDYFDNAAPADIATLGDYSVLPTTSSGFDHLGQQIAGLLDKLDALPLKDAVESAATMMNVMGETASTADQTLADINRLLATPGVQELPDSLQASLAQLTQLLAGFRPGSPVYNDLSRAIEELRQTLRSTGEIHRHAESRAECSHFSQASET